LIVLLSLAARYVVVNASAGGFVVSKHRNEVGDGNGEGLRKSGWKWIKSTKNPPKKAVNPHYPPKST